MFWREEEEGIPGIGGVLIELSFGGEDDKSDLCVAEHRNLMSLLEKPHPALGEGDLTVDLVLDPLELNSPSPHLSLGRRRRRRRKTIRNSDNRVRIRVCWRSIWRRF